jgi:uncharacterized protein (DUF952 family)
MIFHIAEMAHWELAKTSGEYRAASLETEGFIHCSTADQVVRVADFVFKGRSDLILVEIDENLVPAEIKYEGETEENFPHIYGPIQLSAVLKAHEFKPNPDGLFSLPPLTK